MLSIAAKQEAFEESIRLKNQFRSLDEDEIEFLDSVLESTRTKEAAVKKETIEQLDLFRRQQEEADKALLAEGAEGGGLNAVAGSPTAEEEQWVVNGKKRKRAKEKPMLKGLKLRKTSSASDKPTDLKAGATSPPQTPDISTNEGGTVKKLPETVNAEIGSAQELVKDKAPPSATVSATPPPAVTQPTGKGVTGLGLDNYSSDESGD